MARHRLIACEVLYREFCAAVAISPNLVDMEIVPQGLHSKPSGQMSGELQRRLDAAERDPCETVLLGYALCNNGIAGLRAGSKPVVVLRAHDCITCYFGSRERYAEAFKARPGTYYLTSGWIERVVGDGTEELGFGAGGLAGLSPAERAQYDQYVRKFGEEEAQYLMETLGAWKKHYDRILFIDMGLGDGQGQRCQARAVAERRGLRYEETAGDLRLFHALVNGPPWDAHDFLVLQPGQTIHPSYDEEILAARPNA